MTILKIRTLREAGREGEAFALLETAKQEMKGEKALLLFAGRRGEAGEAPMNQKWDEIKERLSKLSLPQENIEPLTFLPPAEWHVERCKKREVLIVAETMPQHKNSICLVVDLRGRVYRANLPAYEIYQYCANSFEQFLLIAERYLSIYREGRNEDCEKCEKEFRDYIQTVDSTALADERTMWSVYAEEMGYGF